SVSIAANGQQAPMLAWDGTNYLAVWVDARNPATATDVYGARIPQTVNAVLEPAGIPISTSPNTQQAPAIAASATEYLLVWADSRNAASGFDIYGARVDTAGALLDPTGLLISNNAAVQSEPAVAFTNGVYLVVWQD